MRKWKILAGVCLACAILVGVGGKFGSYTFGDPIEHLKKELGEDFAYVSEVRVRSFGPLSWSTYEVFEVEPSWGIAGGTEEEVLQELIEGMRQYIYDGGQSDPMLMDSLGSGNCQAFTLYAKELLDEAGMANSIVLEETHMYNAVEVDGDVYLVDFAKGTLVKEGVDDDES